MPSGRPVCVLSVISVRTNAEPRLVYNGYGPSVSEFVTVQVPLEEELLEEELLLLLSLLAAVSFLHASINIGTDVAPIKSSLINFLRDCSIVIHVLELLTTQFVLQNG